MVACDSTLGTIAWDTESSWGEAVTTFTYGIQPNGPVELTGIKQPMLPGERTVARRNDGTTGIPGAFEDVELSFSCHLTGRGATSASSVSLSDLYRLIGTALGTSAVAASSGDTLTGGTTAAPATTGASGFSAGSIAAIGALGDGDGNGQAVAVSTHSSNTLNLLTEIDGAPANGAVLYAPDLAYTSPSTCALTGVRMRAQTADYQYTLHGGWCSSISFTGLNPGEKPGVSFTYKFSYAAPLAATFPTTPTADTFTPRPVTAGSCFFNSVGTTTRAKLAVRSFGINIALNVVPVPGPDGVNAFQKWVGATKIMDQITVSCVVDSEGADTTPTYWDAWLTNAKSHLLYTACIGDTYGVAFYFPALCYMGDRPTQNSTNGRNTIPLQFMAYNGATTTSDLTLSAMRIAGW